MKNKKRFKRQQRALAERRARRQAEERAQSQNGPMDSEEAIELAMRIGGITTEQDEMALFCKECEREHTITELDQEPKGVCRGCGATSGFISAAFSI